MTTRTRSPRKIKPVKAKKRVTPADRLLRAAAKYIEANGGTVIMAGPIQIMRWPGDADYKWSLCVQVMGRAPRPPESLPTPSG
jgi:hypothetical protein